MEEIDKHEIVEDAPITQVITEEFIAKFEKQAELYQEKYLPICLKLTNENDWVSHAPGKFYLQSSGAEKVCNPLGIVWDSPIVTKREMQDELGPYYEIEVQGIIQSRVLKRYIWTPGNCSSRDQFFIARSGGGKKPSDPEYNRENEILARQRIEEGEIRKAAYSNWIVNGVTRLAGIRNPTAAMLEKAGLKPDHIQRIDYSGRRTPEADSSKISEAQGKRLWAIAKQHEVTDFSLRSYLSEHYKVATINDILRKDYEAICKWAEASSKQERQAGQEG